MNVVKLVGGPMNTFQNFRFPSSLEKFVEDLDLAMKDLVTEDYMTKLCKKCDAVNKHFSSNNTKISYIKYMTTDSSIVYQFDIPGISKSNLSVKYKDDKLCINAKREQSVPCSSNTEETIKLYDDNIDVELPIEFDVNSEDIKAKYLDGVLTVEFKLNKPRETTIQIQ